jgi:hypothetical protein
MLKHHKELSPAERCRKNNWYPGCVLKATTPDREDFEEYWQITAIGEYEVLGKRMPPFTPSVLMSPQTNSGETIMQFGDCTWRIKERA